MKSKILALADLHLSDRSRDDYRFHFLRRLHKTILTKNKIDGLVIAGDLTEDKDRHSAQFVNEVVGYVAALADVVPIAVLMGNHDYRNEGHPFFAFLSHVPNVIWIDKPYYCNVQDSLSTAVFGDCLFLPHTFNHEEDWKPFQKAFTKARAVFTHQLYNGANVGFGREVDGIDPDYFPSGTQVISGDVHVPQRVGPVRYIGAPYTVDFGDDYEGRGLILSDRKITQLTFSDLPQKYLIEASSLLRVRAKLSGLNPGSVIKVRMAVEDVKDWPELHAQIVAAAKAARMILYRAEPIVSAKAVRRNVKVAAAASTQNDAAVINAYAKRIGLEAGDVKIGQAIAKDVL